MVGPDVAYFGQKDAQQATVIKRLVRDLDIPVRIEVCPTVRDADGLALSSRNALLSPAERARATALHRALGALQQAVERRRARPRRRASTRRWQSSRPRGIEPEYFELVSADTMAPVRSASTARCSRSWQPQVGEHATDRQRTDVDRR